ncbi:hypothetical protein ACLOJK_001955 [Asimina triloba]
MPLLSVVKSLFNHIWDVVKDVPSFQSEYGTILRHLLARREYRFHMRKRVYNCLVLLFISQVETAIHGKRGMLSNTKEEVFRYILTLHSLLENPPGDFPDNLREDLIKGFIGFFSHLRSEGARDDKVGALANSQQGLMELASSVFYQACVHTSKASSSEKRLRRESAAACLRDGLVKGKWLWIGAFCFLIRNYGSRISKALVSYWFEGICESFERYFNLGSIHIFYDAGEELSLMYVLPGNNFAYTLLYIGRPHLWKQECLGILEEVFLDHVVSVMLQRFSNALASVVQDSE